MAKDMSNIVWKSDSTQNYYWFDATDDEIIQLGEDLDLLDDFIDDDGNVDVSGLRDRLVDYDDEADYDDLVMNVAPAIARQCPGNYLWLIGNYQRWDGGHHALGFYKDAARGIVDACYPGYDSTSELYYNDEGYLAFGESSHDAPMGGTEMVLYRLRDDRAEDEIEAMQDEYGDWYSITYAGDDIGAVEKWIESGILVPITSLDL